MPEKKTISATIAAVLDAIAVLASLLVVSLMVFLVIARYLLGLSIVGLHELILLFTLQLYMVGAMIAARRRSQITVDWLAQRFAGGRAAAWHELVIALITLVATAFFVIWAYRMLAWGLERPQTTPALGLSLAISQASILFCSIGCAGFALRDLLQSVFVLRARE